MRDESLNPTLFFFYQNTANFAVECVNVFFEKYVKTLLVRY